MLKENCLYRLPKQYHGHCLHGLVIVRKRCGSLQAEDTYWGGGIDPRIYPIGPLEGVAEFLMDMAHAKDVYRRTWEQYADKDRAYIPIGGGSEKWLVDSRAEPVKARQVEQLRYEIDNAKGDIRFAENEIKLKSDEIERITRIRHVLPGDGKGV